jgi:XTP/dITP diphosphohydrolase
VQHLNGKPGVHSARYAGEPRNTERNVEKLLKELQGVPEAQRQASFYCAIVLMRHSDDPVPLIFEGRWDGSILTARTGQHGFGYDSVFYVKEFQKSAAELEPAVKNTVSHRAKALRKLRDYFYAKSESDKLD